MGSRKKSESTLTDLQPRMRRFAIPILARLMAGILVAAGVGSGCDTLPAPDRDQRRPSVTNLQIRPDSIHESDLSSEQVVDSLAQVGLDLSVRATDPDGTVERVAFVFEPSSTPRGTLSGSLPAQGEAARYGGRLGLSIPLIDEVYTIRVFAVDDDSLAGNQVTGQFRFVPTDTSEAAGDTLRMQVNRPSDDS